PFILSLSLHDALPISFWKAAEDGERALIRCPRADVPPSTHLSLRRCRGIAPEADAPPRWAAISNDDMTRSFTASSRRGHAQPARSEEHTSELQSRRDL